MAVRWSNTIKIPPIHTASTITVRPCGKYFDDLTDAVFSDSKQTLHHWITVMYMMHIHASNRQTAQELAPREDTAQRLCSVIREGVLKNGYTAYWMY